SLVCAVPATALVVASNCPSGYFGPDVHDYYYNHPSGMGWLAPLMFADGAGAVVFRSTPRDRDSRPKGLLSVRYETDPDVPLITRNFQMLQEDWPTNIKPATGTDFNTDAVARWYLHQANGVVVRRAVEMLGLPPERVPIGVDYYGNTSASSTLILLDEDRR